MSVLRFGVRGAALGVTAFSAIVLGSCSDPAPAPAQGAFTAEFGNAPGNTCPATSPSSVVAAGAVNSKDRAPVIDGEGGAAVSCTVVPAGGGFAASGSISLGSASFGMSSVQITGTTGTGTVTLKGANTAGVYRPVAGSTCNFTLISADAGRLWASFECPTVERTGVSNSLCAVVNGYVVLENCAAE